MPRTPLTYELAKQAAHDEGNRSMRRHRREIWDLEDYRVAAEMYNRLCRQIDERKDNDHGIS